MKNCSEIRELISLYIDNRLDEVSAKELEEHIRSCKACSEELSFVKMMVEACSSSPEEELPANFREELHNKLLAVKESEDKKHKIKSLRNQYIKICSTVAAVLMLVVFMRGFFLTINYKTADLNTKSESKEQAQMEQTQMEQTQMEQTQMDRAVSGADENAGQSQVQAFNEKGSQPNAVTVSPQTSQADTENVQNSPKRETTGIQENPMVQRTNNTQEAPKLFETQQKEQVAVHPSKDSSPEEKETTKSIARGTDFGLKEKLSTPPPDCVADTKKADTADIIINKNTEITIKVAQPDIEAGKIRALAAGMDLQPTEKKPASTEMTIQSTTAAMLNQRPADNIQLILKIPETQYDKFEKLLKESYGVSFITENAVNTVDVTDTIIELNNKLNELNARISKLESGGNISNPDELTRLKTEIDKTTTEIDRLKTDSAYIQVIVTIVKK